MTRRTFVESAAALGAALALPRRAGGADRPDVLFIAIEDISPRLGCYGHPLVKTPNFDRLAARGVRFDLAYCQAPLCNASRASVITGVRHHSMDVWPNEIDWRAHIPAGVKTLPEWFRAAGYRTVRAGKINHAQNLFKEVDRAGEAREQAWWDEQLPTPGTKARTEPRQPSRPRPESLKPDDYVARRLRWGPNGLRPEEGNDAGAARAIAAKLRRRGAQPQFLALGLHAPHYPQVAPDQFWELYRPADIPLPEYPADDLQDVPGSYAQRRIDTAWLTPDEQREVIAGHFACISYADWCLGVVLDALHDSGRERDTIVCVWGDHGLLMGEHGCWEKPALFEETCRVPFLMAGPGVAEGRVCARPVELIDMYPTLADLAGLDPPPGAESISMRPILADPDRAWKKAAFTGMAKPQRSLRTARWRYTEWGGPDKVELYDHETDPAEHRNLAADPAHAATRAELAALLAGGWREWLPEG